MFSALSDFIIFCRVERRLSELTCGAYERDVRACIAFLRTQGIATVAEIRTPDLRRFLAEEARHRPAPSSRRSRSGSRSVTFLSLWRLCRSRHKEQYADARVMPTARVKLLQIARLAA
jgi:site-specific recombinase XerD